MAGPPLRLLVLSDLHVDYPQNLARVPKLVQSLQAQEADAFVLAGDIGHKLEQVEGVLRAFAVLDMPKLFVCGNHDVWIVREGREDVVDSWDKMRRIEDLCRRHGFVPLDAENASVGGFQFVGSMGWYDYSFARADLGISHAEYEKKTWQDLTYMDLKYARFGMDDAGVLDRMLHGLEARLARAQPPVVFVSHHVPREDLVLRRGHPSWDFFNAYMGSRRTEALLHRHGVRRLVFGHTHRPVALVEPGRCTINNPVGYPRQALTPLARPFVVS